ncbi:MAG TPA: DUF302 domain-containing protein [Gammaproteobacteria bacterium]|nr:DUF302 domain-containing protein [Gammaproteobacteria bacterium]
MKNMMAALLVLSLQVVALAPVSAEGLMMARSQLYFPEAMTALQESILAHGYKITRVQRVDIGLTGFGYKTDKYRLVFFAKADEVNEMTRKEPGLYAYLPLQVVIFAEQENTLLVALHPRALSEYFPAAELRTQFLRWESDMNSIFDDVRNAE